MQQNVNPSALSPSGFATGIWGSPTDLYQAIYEEIENIPPVKDPALTHGSGL